MPSEISLWLWLLPRRILKQPRLLPYGCARGCRLGAGARSPSQGAGATLGFHQFPSFSLPFPSLLWELSSGHPGGYRAPLILSTEGRSRGVGQGWPGSLPPPNPQPRTCSPTDTLEQMGLFSDMHWASHLCTIPHALTQPQQLAFWPLTLGLPSPVSPQPSLGLPRAPLVPRLSV